MRYEDTSGSISGSAVVGAHDDADSLANGSNGPATGNVITGAGTITGKAGADTPASGHIVAVRGASGTDASDSGTSLHVDGRFGTLAIDDHGNYKYVADGHAPANFRDLFQYTLADSKGGRSVADLVISRGGEIKVADNAQKITPNADGTVTLPAGVDLNDVHVVGRDLVVDMPDGTQIVIVDGAVFVPQLVLGGVEVPSTNLAALLIDAEPKPAAGTPQSSGGNFDVPVPPLDPGVPLGDLIPPTGLTFIPPTFKEVNGFIDREPTIQIQPDGQPASVAAVDSVNEKGLPTRNGGEPAGSGEIADGNGANNSDTSEAHGGTIIIDSPDGVSGVSINGVAVTGVPGQVISGAFGTLTITGFSGTNILYTYTLTDNTSGDTTHDDFSVTVTDPDGDQATATLVVNIIDDTPTARPDTDAVAAGTYGPETGNVLTGVGTTSGAAGADTVGADNAHITNVTGFNGSTDNTGPFVVNGQYGVLTLQADGSYSYTRNPGTPGGVNDVFNYTLTDGDGDPSTTTLTISIGDATPHTGENGVVQLDDDALANGNPGGVGDDPDSVNATGALAGGGGDGPITFAVQTTGAPAGFSYVSGGAGIVLVQQNGHTVLTVTVDAAGNYSVVQNAPIDHPAGSNENNDVFTINYNVTDQDGDSAPGSFTINVDDDTPTVGIADRGVPSLTVDETDLGTNATASFANNFSHSFGADGPAAAGSLAYSLGISAPGADSGLIDVATGQAVVLVLNNGVVEGHVGNAAGALAFTVSVNAAGDVTLDQIRALQHPDTTNPDDSVTLSASNLVTLTLAVTDHDGDTVSQSLNIGTSLHFEDDGPSIGLSGSEPSLTVDETNLAVNASASVAGAFTSVFGADGAGTVTYQLGVTGGNGTASGLTDVATGQSIVLVNNAGVIEGHVGNAAGALAFTVSIDSAGTVTLDQIRAVVHPNTANPDDSVSLAADNLITITGTVTDKDGDSASAVLNFGQNLNFKDDGPSIGAGGAEPTLTVDETNLAINATASFAGNFTGSFGADGAGTISYSLSVTGGNGTASGLIDVATGQSIVLVNNAGTIEGHVGNAAGALAFTVSVNAAGDVTLDQIRAVQHPDATNPNDNVTLSNDNLVVLNATITDRDGDQANASLNIGQNLNFHDDGPAINASGEQPSLTVDETNLAVNASGDFSGLFAGSFGADGAGSIHYALGITGASGVASGLTDVATGQSIVLVNNNGVVEGHVGNAAGALAFTVTIDGNTGVVTLDQIRAVVHPNTSNPDDSVTLANDNLVTISATITDRDGDTASATANIGQNLNFKDDGPSISLGTAAEPQLTVDETVLLTDASSSFAGAFNSAFGADGAGTVTYALSISANLANSGLVDTLSGQPIVLVMSADGTFVEGRVGNAAGAVAFTVTVNGSGNVTLDQQRAVIHPNTANPDDSITLSADNLVQLTATVTDKDGDHQSATLNIGQNLHFEDDGPSANNDSDTITSGGTTAQGNVITGVGTNEGAVNADQPGADTFGSVTTIHSNGSGLTDTTFTAGVLSIHGSFGTLEMDANGNYTYTRDGGSPGNVSESFTYTYVDKDGDPATATLTININDSAPTLPDPAPVLLDDDALAGGNPGGTGDDVDSQGTPGQLVGSGGDGALTYSFSGLNTLPAGFTVNPVDASHLQVLQGATVVLTITLNTSTGVFSVVQNHAIDHSAGAAENNTSFGIGVQVADADNDTDPAVITINVDDDTPTVTALGAQPNLTVDETVLGTNDTKDFSGLFSHSFGADGAAAANSVTYALGITGGNGVDSGLDDVATGQNIVLVLNGTVVEGHVGNAAGALAFTVSVDGSGNVTLDQIRAVVHPNAANPDDSVSLANDNLVTLTQTVTDHDGDQASATANIGQNLNFEDDGPSAAIVTTGAAVSVDESVGIQVDSNDTTSAAVIALFSGVTGKGVDTDLPQYATNANAVVASTGTTLGADGGTVAFSLNVSSAGVDSGLNTTDGQDILLYKEGNLIVGRVGSQAGAAAFAVAIDSTGHISTVEYLSIQHPNAGNPDDSLSIANGAISAVVTATDGDNDTSSASVAIGNLIQFQDSGPVMTAASNINIQNSGDVAHTGAFAFNLGADGANTSNDVITNVTGSATVGGVPVQNWTLTAGAENATTASYSFSFDYAVGGGSTAHETGTLTFDKAAGTYTIDLDNPIQGVTTILQTSQGTLFQGYEFGTSTPDGSQPEISVTQIQDLAGTTNDIYVQFTGVAEPSSGTGDNNLELTSWVPGANNPPPVNGGGDTAFNAGDLFNQTDSWVSTSNSANGVAGDTIQGGEVLDFTLVQGANPTGVLAQPGTFAQASAMFLKFDGIGSGEDMIVVLKLYDATTNSYTTRAVMIQNADIIKGPGAGPGQYSGVSLDNNDGLVIIESNDYNLPGEHWVIVGAQVAGSDEGITGTAINLNGAIGAAGDSITGNAFDTQSFATDTNDGPFKISSIGFLTTQTTPQNAQLDFNVTVTDGDGDSVTQAVSATVTAAADTSTPIALSPSVTTVAAAPLHTKTVAAVSEPQQTTQQQTAANTNVLAGALAAAGLAATDSAAAASHGAGSHSGQNLEMVAHHAVAAPIEADSAVSAPANDLMPALNAHALAAAQAASHTAAQAQSHAQQGADGGAQQQAPAALLHGTAAAAHADAAPAPAAAAVAMPAAAQLAGAHNPVIGQVLADALHGGANAPTIDSVLNALPGQANAHTAALEALASHAGGAASDGNGSAFAGYAQANGHFMMEQMVVHADAPTHA